MLILSLNLVERNPKCKYENNYNYISVTDCEYYVFFLIMHY